MNSLNERCEMVIMLYFLDMGEIMDWNTTKKRGQNDVRRSISKT